MNLLVTAPVRFPQSDLEAFYFLNCAVLDFKWVVCAGLGSSAQLQLAISAWLA